MTSPPQQENPQHEIRLRGPWEMQPATEGHCDVADAVQAFTESPEETHTVPLPLQLVAARTFWARRSFNWVARLADDEQLRVVLFHWPQGVKAWCGDQALEALSAEDCQQCFALPANLTGHQQLTLLVPGMASDAPPSEEPLDAAIEVRVIARGS